MSSSTDASNFDRAVHALGDVRGPRRQRRLTLSVGLRRLVVGTPTCHLVPRSLTAPPRWKPLFVDIALTAIFIRSLSALGGYVTLTVPAWWLGGPPAPRRCTVVLGPARPLIGCLGRDQWNCWSVTAALAPAPSVSRT